MRPIILIASALAAIALAAPCFAQPERGDRPRRSAEDRPNRPGPIDPEKDEVLLHIRAAVEPTEEQMTEIISRYKTLRREQRDVVRTIGRKYQREIREQDGLPGPELRATMMAELNEKVVPLNEAFLTDCRALLTEEQHEGWDGCIADLDLSPQLFRRGSGLDPKAGPQIGDTAPAFALKDLEGEEVTLESLLDKPVVVEFGSYTCPIYRRQIDGIEALRAEFGDRVNFVLIYTKEAHPIDGWVVERNTREGIEIPQHTAYDERFACAKRMQKALDLKLTILVDDFDDTVTSAYAGFPNRGYVLDAEGKVVSRQVWIEAEGTGRALRELLNY